MLDREVERVLGVRGARLGEPKQNAPRRRNSVKELGVFVRPPAVEFNRCKLNLI